MRISDWSSDVCSSDLPSDSLPLHLPPHGLHRSPPVRRLDSGELVNVEPGLFEHRLGIAERPKAFAAMICPHPQRPDTAARPILHPIVAHHVCDRHPHLPPPNQPAAPHRLRAPNITTRQTEGWTN